MWVSKNQWKWMVEDQAKLEARVLKLESAGKSVLGIPTEKSPEFVIHDGQISMAGYPYGIAIVGRKVTTVDKVLRLILRHLNIEVTETDAKASDVVLKSVKTVKARL